MAKKEFSWEFIWETAGRKYFLVKKADDEYFIFRSPGTALEKAKNYLILGNREGEKVPWGAVPAKIRIRVASQKIKPSPQNQDILISEQL